MHMDSVYEEHMIPGSVRILAIVFLVYSIFLLFFGFTMPTSDLPPNTIALLFSLLMMCLMPIELILEYVFYLVLAKRTKPENILGIAALLLTVGSVPAIYGFLIGIMDSLLQLPGAIAGLVFSLSGLLLAWTLINKIWESAISNPT